MKKCLSLGLAAVLAMSTLAACGGNAAPAGNDAPAAEVEGGEEAAAPAADGEVYHMVMQITNYGFNDPDLQMVQDAVNEITVPEIGVEVEFLPIPIMEQATKLGLLVSGGEQIDLVCAGLLTTPATLVSQGLLQPITQYVESSEALMKLSEGVLDACRVNGDIYAYPGTTANAQQTSFWYDKDLAEQYNIQIPEKLATAEDWEALLSQVKASGMEQYGISLGDGVACEYEWADYDSLGDDALTGYGVIMAGDDTDTVVNYYATEEYMNKCKMHREWFEKGYCVPDSISNGYTTTDTMTQGVIFGFASGGGTGTNAAYFSKITGKNLGGIPMTEINTKTSHVVNWCWGVSTTCERPDKVVDFLELLYTNTDLANLLQMGIEGVHYVVNEGSKIVDYPEGVDATNCGYGSFVGSYGDVLKTYQRPPFTDEEVAGFTKFAYPEAAISKYLGYTFDTTNVSTAYTAVSAVIGQYATALECGTVDPEAKIPEFLDALEAAGINDVIAENQAQLNAWLGK